MQIARKTPRRVLTSAATLSIRIATLQRERGVDGEELRHLRKSVVRRLEALEQERAGLAQEGHAQEARGILRAFQEVARLLEEIDEILAH